MALRLGLLLGLLLLGFTLLGFAKLLSGPSFYFFGDIVVYLSCGMARRFSSLFFQMAVGDLSVSSSIYILILTFISIADI